MSWKVAVGISIGTLALGAGFAWWSVRCFRELYVLIQGVARSRNYCLPDKIADQTVNDTSPSELDPPSWVN